MKEKNITIGIELSQNISKEIALFNEKYLQQFSLKIPPGVIHRVDEYKKEYFGYLKESVYKSNICYLLQCIDFQLWLYRLFKPSLSAENAYFYQLLISMGITAEALATAILMDILLPSKESSLSKNSENDQKTSMDKTLQEKIIKNSFQNNIRAIEKLKILPLEVSEKYQNIRGNIRNLVHLQNWTGSLYQNLTLEKFQEKMGQFKFILLEVKENISMNHSKKEIQNYFFADIDFQKEHSGTIVNYSEKKGYGFIKTYGINKELYFHASNFIGPEKQVQPNAAVLFYIYQGKKGPEAGNIRLLKK